ncbi:MAG: Nif3-like dinuclear metal center hexameric protein [Christensenellales bacterium]
MSVSTDDFVSAVEAIAPPELAESWDNTGLLLRCGDTVSKALIALDVTDDTADEAIEDGCDIILAHHPLIFEPVRSFDCRIPNHNVAMRLIRAGISLYAAHTSYDAAKGGINDALAEKIDLTDITSQGLFRVGNMEKPCEKDEFLSLVKNALCAESLSVSTGRCGRISRVAVAGGGGGCFVKDAQKAGAQALLTGEAKHSHFIEASSLGILLVAAGHYHTERLFADSIFIGLQSRLNEVKLDLALKKSKRCKAPYKFR